MARRNTGRGQRRLTSFADWLDRHTYDAPAALRSRVLEYTAGSQEGEPSTALATAGRRALDRVLAHPGDRSVALDLLAADALITLALLAEAEHRPERLGEFAAGLLR
jgi:hypothetical protein